MNKNDTASANSDLPRTAKDINPDLEKLRVYSQVKMKLASQLRIVREALMALGLDNAEQQCRHLIVKLAEDHFTLAVLGQFKRGKSSLMNAIIGRELLPTGVLPLTSAITRLRYGPEERLVIRRENFTFTEELPIASLPDYVTEKGNPSNQRKVKDVCVELPVPFFRRGIEFVDTPGIGSAITANTEITYSFLPQCDAVVFVTAADTPMTGAELSFLKEICEYVDKLFFVVNKMDLVTENERNEVLQFITETIQSQTGCDVLKLFPVSAHSGLIAKANGDSALYEVSGLKALEESLASFLSEEKSVDFLQSVANSVLKILNHESERGAFSEAALKERTEVIQSKDYIMLKRNPHEAAAAIMEAQIKIQMLRKSIVIGRMEMAVNVNEPHPIQAKPEATVSTILAPSPEAEHLKTRGCSVCRQISKYMLDFFAQWQYQIAAEERAQSEFASELGFCPLHTWQLLAVCSSHGASIGFAQLAEQISHRLRVSHADGTAIRRLVHDSRNCRVCELLRQAEDEYIGRLAAQFDEASFKSSYRHSQGVCLRHLGMLMDAVKTAEIRDFLLFHAADRFEEDAEDMRSYALKRDALRRALENRDEADAYRRAVIRIVGDRNVCVPWPEDGEI